jgi:uncharacterized damage-inducible protein DinB
MRNRTLNCIAIAVLALTGPATISAQELTQAEKDHAIQYLESTKKEVLDATKGLSQAQWNFKPAPDRWSCAQVMEHIAAAEDLIRDGLVKQQIMVSPAGDSSRDVKGADATIEARVPDRSHKVQAPEPLVPTNRYGTPEASLKHFLESREATEQYVTSTPGLRAHVGDGPAGKMDGYEGILMVAAHSERHVKQILEVKADPNFPKT